MSSARRWRVEHGGRGTDVSLIPLPRCRGHVVEFREKCMQTILRIDRSRPLTRGALGALAALLPRCRRPSLSDQVPCAPRDAGPAAYPAWFVAVAASLAPLPPPRKLQLRRYRE
jgi:hypothetical protein